MKLVETFDNIEIENYIDVRSKAESLGCNVPTGIALLPRNFNKAESKYSLIHESTASTVRKLWKQSNVLESPIEKNAEKYAQICEEAFQWIGPTIFIPALIITQNPYLVSMAINVISNYLTDWFKGISSKSRLARLSVVVETKSGISKRINYKGPVNGLKELPAIIKEVYDETRNR